MAEPTFYGAAEFNDRVIVHNDLTVYGCLYLKNPSCGIVFETQNGNRYSITTNNAGNVVVNTINNYNSYSPITLNTEIVNNVTNEIINNGYGTRTISEGLPGGGATPDNDVGEDGDTWLVVEC